MAQIDYVRVVDADGIEQSVPVKKYEAFKSDYRVVNTPAIDPGGSPLRAFGPGDVPAKNASVDEWRAFARDHADARGLLFEQVEFGSRDDLVAAFSAAPPAKTAASGTASTSEES